MEVFPQKLLRVKKLNVIRYRNFLAQWKSSYDYRVTETRKDKINYDQSVLSMKAK